MEIDLKFKNSHYKAEKKSCRKLYNMGIKTYQEKNTKPMEKELAQSDLPVRRKIQKNTRKCHFYEKQYLRVVFLDFSPNW